MDVQQKLRELGYELPEPPKAIAAYVPCVRTGNLVYVSGQLPLKDGDVTVTGKVPSAVSVESAYAAAARCAVQALAIVGSEIGGDWSRLKRVVRIGAWVQSDDNFVEQPKVANGASELLQKVLGEAGRHARAAVGVNTLPLNATVEVEFLFEIS